MEQAAAQRRTTTKERGLKKADSVADFLFTILSVFRIHQLAAAKSCIQGLGRGAGVGRGEVGDGLGVRFGGGVGRGTGVGRGEGGGGTGVRCGGGVGRVLAVGRDLGVGVTRGVLLGVPVAVALAVAVAVGVMVGVVEAVTVGLGLTVGVGEGPDCAQDPSAAIQ